MSILNVNIIETDIVEYSDRHVGSLERDGRRCGMSDCKVTNEMAIELLNSQRPKECFKILNKAYDMAIEALQMDMSCNMDKVLEDLYKLQKECPELEIILETKNGTVSCKIDDANIYIGINKELVFDAE